MKRWQLCAQTGALVLAATAFAWSGPDAGQPSAEALECFQWFSKLGFPDVNAAKYAEIWTGDISWNASGPPKAITERGFVLGVDDNWIEALALNLERVRYRKDVVRWSVSPPSSEDSRAHTSGAQQSFRDRFRRQNADTGFTWELKRVAFEERPFLEEAKKLLEDMRATPPRKIWRVASFSREISPSAQVFFAAYVCWQKGAADLAQELYVEAEKLRCPPSRETNLSMLREMEENIGDLVIRETVLKFGNGLLGMDGATPYLSRSETAAALREFLSKYPNHSKAGKIRTTIATLERMVEEDKAHPMLTDQELAALPAGARAKEYIFRLRNQKGSDWEWPTGRAVKWSPANLLVRMDLSVVPQLIEALNEERVARVVSGDELWPIGKCVQRILEEIAGRQFQRSWGFDRMALEVWWSEIQQREQPRKASNSPGAMSGSDPVPSENK